MKIWPIYCAALLAVASVALANDDSGNAKPATAAPAAAFNWPVTAAATNRIKISGVPNFGKLNDNIWRSGQPTKAGYEGLAKQGLKTVVNLREEFPQDKDLIPEGVKYVYIPVKDEHEPTAEQGNQFLDIAADPKNWPILVHCHGGEGRAGVMSALVRHSFDGWDNKMVMKEVGNFRTKHVFFTVPMAGCQQTFIQQWEAANPAKRNLGQTANTN
jgi:protein tyrosine/serine phosphatase